MSPSPSFRIAFWVCLVSAAAAAKVDDSASWLRVERLADDEGIESAWIQLTGDGDRSVAGQIQEFRLILSRGGPAALRRRAEQLDGDAAERARLMAALDLGEAATARRHHAALSPSEAEGIDALSEGVLDAYARISFLGNERSASIDSTLDAIEELAGREANSAVRDYFAQQIRFLRGNLRVRRGEVEGGIEDAIAAAGAMVEAGWQLEGARMRYQLARVFQNLGRIDEAAAEFRWAAVVAEQLGDRRLYAVASSWLAFQHERAGRYRECYELEREVVPLILEHGDLQTALYATLSYGWSANHIGEYEQSLELYADAAELADRVDSAWGRAQARLNLGWALLEGGDEELAALNFEEGAEIAREAGNVAQEADLLNGSASAELRWGRPDRAAESYRRLADLHRERADERRELGALSNLALALRTMGENEAAVSLAIDVHQRNREAGRPQGVPDVNLANWLYRDGRYDEAAAILDPILAESQSRDLRCYVEALAVRGRSRLWQGRYAEAAEILGRVDRLRSARGDDRPRIALLREIARAYWSSGDFDRGRAALSQLEELMRVLDPSSIAVAFADRACLELTAGNRELALEQARAAARALSYGVGLEEPEVANARLSTYDRLINVAIVVAGEATGEARQSLVEESFAWLQRLKARSLWDCVRGSARELRPDVDPALAAAEAAAKRDWDSINRRLQHPILNSSERDSLTRVRSRAQAARVSAHARILAEDERYRLATSVVLPSVEELREEMIDPEGTVVLDFFISSQERGYPRRAALYVLHAGGIELHDLGPAEELDQKLDLVLGLLDEAAPGVDEALLERALENAGDLLLASAAPALAGAERLIVVPDALLGAIPFAALRLEGQFLVERWPIETAPSLAVLSGLRQREQRRPRLRSPALAVWESGDGHEVSIQRDQRRGSPGELPLRHAPLERDLLLNGYRNVSWLGREHDAGELLETYPQLGEAGILHFIAHGYFDERQPWRSALYLDPGMGEQSRRLDARDVYRLDLAAEHVTLSACETARMPGVRGRGLEGLAQAFFVAGSRSILATQWSADDRSTAQLMDAFYRGLADGQSRAQALRSAQLQLLGEPGSRHPFFWAPFVLLGDGSRGLPLTRSAALPPAGLGLGLLILASALAWRVLVVRKSR